MNLPARMMTLVVLLAAGAPAQTTRPYDVLHDAYARYMFAGDPLGFPLKIKSLTENRYKFWRGSKDLFFRWCRTNAADWLADTEAAVPCHGDLHLGNLGTYPIGWQKLAFGMVDFDDADRMPFQIELLQGLITLELVAEQNGIPLTRANREALVDALLTSYRAGSVRDLANDPLIAAMLQRESRSYADELALFTADGKFRPVIEKKSAITDVLRPAPAMAEPIAQALARAVEESPELRGVMRYRTSEEFARAIRDVALRTRLGSSGSQGLKKYLVLMERPLAGVDSDVMIYLKQQIPTAAQRSSAIATVATDLPAGQRADAMLRALCDPPAMVSGFCELQGESYWIGIKEPWSDELNPAWFDTFERLLGAARLWGSVAGAAHGSAGGSSVTEVTTRLTPDFRDQLLARSRGYVDQLAREFGDLFADIRVSECCSEVEKSILALRREKNPGN